MWTRRDALRLGAAAGAAGLAGPFSFCFERAARAERFGPLRRDPAGVLDLPEGFAYRVVDRAGDAMDDGYRVPGRPDAMAAFPGPEGSVVLVRNHELDRAHGPIGPYPSGEPYAPEAYDARAQGGVSRVVLEGPRFDRRRSNLLLAGTSLNCAGGVSPWGWLTCEETVEDGHGYVFLVGVDGSRPSLPRRIPGYGRFRHEAAVVDPTTHVAYLTEDRPDGALYRFRPDRPEAPFVGRLEALAVRGKPGFDTSSDAMRAAGVAGLDVEWVPVEEPDPRGDTVRAEARSRGAAVVRRGEGLWFDPVRAEVFVVATEGGAAALGQVFRLRLGRGGALDRLDLLVESTGERHLDNPDNVTVAPWGDLVVAEDGRGRTGGNALRGITPAGEVYPIAQYRKSTTELAGVCFDPTGRALFVNAQSDGLTLAVVGPFPAPRDGRGVAAPVAPPSLEGISEDLLRPPTAPSRGARIAAGALAAACVGGAGYAALVKR